MFFEDSTFDLRQRVSFALFAIFAFNTSLITDIAARKSRSRSTKTS